MNTIESPSDGNKKIKEAFPDATFVHASFAEYSGVDQWSVTAFFKVGDDARGYGSTIEEAIAAAKAEYDPNAKLRKEAEAAGYVLVRQPTE